LAGEPLVIDGCTLSSLKWAGRAPDGTVLVRVFVGSHTPSILAGSDSEIFAAVERDLAQVAGVHGAPILARVARSIDQMPKYTVGHLQKVAGANAALAGLPNLAIAGAAFRGVGVPDCIAQGRAAAARVGEALSGGVPGPAEVADAVPVRASKPARSG
jgi:oxygen-dependent protoporphyrinogen oxidase